MAGSNTRYDLVQYPAGLYPTTHPGHLAMLARLHGLAAADPATARVMEVAGGDGTNLLAMAAALPDAHFYSFDLSAAAVARGAALAEAAGLDNIRIEVGDVIDLAATMDEEYDYIIVHGLYAWVPEVVREATLRLIGRVLSPDGIAFLSYNALPGGHLRRAVREMLLHEVADITDPGDRVERARAILADFVQPRDTDRAALTGMRHVAEPMLRKNAGSLYHDELSDHYAPQALKEVVAAAASHGLAFLNDAMPAMIHDGMPGSDMSDAAVVHAAQADDYQVQSYFHQTLLIRPGRAPARQIDPARFDGLYAATQVRRTGPNEFAFGDESFELEDERLADFLSAMAQAAPARLPLAAFANSAEHCEALLRLYQREIIEMHAVPFPAALEPGDRPCASPVARAQIAAGMRNVYTLDLRILSFVEPGPRAFLSLLDGQHDRAALRTLWAGTDYGEQISADDALAQLARAGMILR